MTALISGAEKLKLIRELGIIRKSFTAAKGDNKLTLAKRVNEIRILLSVAVKKPAVIALDLNNRVASIESSIIDYLNHGIMDMPEPLRAVESFTAGKVLELIQQNSGFVISDGLIAEAFRAMRKFNSNTVATDAFEYIKANGGAFEGDSEQIKKVYGLIRGAKVSPPMDSPEVKEQKKLAQQQFYDLKKKLSDLMSINSANGYDQESIDKAA
jgi:hypothetical protein